MIIPGSRDQLAKIGDTVWFVCRTKKRVSCVFCKKPIDGNVYRRMSQHRRVARVDHACLRCVSRK